MLLNFLSNAWKTGEEYTIGVPEKKYHFHDSLAILLLPEAINVQQIICDNCLFLMNHQALETY